MEKFKTSVPADPIKDMLSVLRMDLTHWLQDGNTFSKTKKLPASAW